MTRGRLALWAGVTALAFCAGYFASYFYRAQWQSRHPELAARWPNNGRFSLLGVYGSENMGEELLYAAKVREHAERWIAYDPFIRENRSLRMAISDTLSYRPMSLAFLVLGDIDLAWLALRLACCAAWFLLLYHLALRLTGSEPVAFFCGAFLTCFSYLLTFLFIHYLRFFGPEARSLFANAWSVLTVARTESVYRLPRPGVTYAWLFAAILLHARAAERPDSRRWALSGLFGGLLAYARLDIWSTYLGAAFFIAAIDYWRERRLRLLGSAALAALISLPFLLVNYPPTQEMLERSNSAFGRWFEPWSLVYLGGFLAALRWKREPAALFLGCLLLQAAFIVNMQLVTGYSLVTEHWRFIANILAFLLALSFLPEAWLRRGAWWRGAGQAALALAFLQGMLFAALHYPFQGLPKDHGDALRWLEEHAPLDSVVLALNPEANMLVPAYTRSKVAFGHSTVHISDIPLAEAIARLRAGLRLLSADEERFHKACIEPAMDLGRDKLKTRAVPEENLVKNVYFHGMEDPQALQLWRDAAGAAGPAFGVDFVWIGDFERRFLPPDFPASARLRLQECYRGGSVTIYRAGGLKS